MEKRSVAEMRKNLIINAFEGGSVYWAMIDDTVSDPRAGLENPCKYYSDVPFMGGELRICDDATGDFLGVLNAKTLVSGWKLMKENYPDHYKDVINENDDAYTADTYLQLCVMGDIVFG